MCCGCRAGLLEACTSGASREEPKHPKHTELKPEDHKRTSHGGRATYSYLNKTTVKPQLPEQTTVELPEQTTGYLNKPPSGSLNKPRSDYLKKPRSDYSHHSYHKRTSYGRATYSYLNKPRPSYLQLPEQNHGQAPAT